MIRLLSISPTRSLACAALLALYLLLAAGCQTLPDGRAEPPAQPGPPIGTLRDEPLIRVRITRGASQAALSANDRLVATWQPARGSERSATFNRPLSIRRRGSQFVIETSGRVVAAADADSLTIAPAQGQFITVNGTSYPGAVALTAPDSAAGFDIVNHVALEDYLPGVLDREFYASWHPEAFCAQAVAARSYAIAMMARMQGAHFDVEGGPASQAYGGQTANAKALSAVAATRGLILAWQGRVLTAYYSSCCGGTGQDAAPTIAGAPDIPPLKGRYHGGWCANSPNYRWGPLTIPARTLAGRMAAWGRANRHPIANLRSIRDIEIAARNDVNRPTRFAVVESGAGGGGARRFELGAEQFRFACNYQADGGPTLKSSHVDIRVRSDQVQFIGRGFGHGAGLCQFGAQALALAGHDHPAILAFYYPGAVLDRVY